jgi:hypothetical protein
MPCSVRGPEGEQIHPADAIVLRAEAIVRATAVEYAVAPRDPALVTTTVPDSKIRFQVNEAIRGSVGKELILPGYLVDTDDFNDQQPPYSFVRKNGRSGNCYANSYKAGGQFLLMLQKLKGGDMTVNWYPLGPVNEQLRSESDEWLVWVREKAAQRRVWSPDRSAFYVNERLGSDSALAYVYEASTLERINVRDAIFKADSAAASAAKGHVYFEIEQWQGSQHALARLHGHTDQFPVSCFEFRYEISRTGEVLKLSEHVATASAAGCEE